MISIIGAKSVHLVSFIFILPTVVVDVVIVVIVVSGISGGVKNTMT